MVNTITRLFIMGLLCLCSISCFAVEPTIKLSVYESPPYASKALKNSGFVSQIITEAFALEGVKVELHFFPPARAFHLAEEGIYDGSFIWVWSADRAEHFYYSAPLAEGPLVLFHLKSFPFDWSRIEDLKHINIGTIYKNIYSETFEKALKAGVIKVERVPHEAQNFRKLLKGRIQLFPLNLYFGYALLNSAFSAEERKTVTYHPKPLKTSVYHLLLSKKAPENQQRIAQFNSGLNKLKQSGRFDQIVKSASVGAKLSHTKSATPKSPRPAHQQAIAPSPPSHIQQTFR